jgi:hypothetical protein
VGLASNARHWQKAFALALLALGCGTADVQGDPLSVGLPPRTTAGDGGTDPQVTPPPPAPPPPPTDAGPDSAAAAKLCGVSDLAVCFPFEGSVTDLSPRAIVPATVTNVSFVAGRDGQAGSFDATSALRLAPNDAFESSSATIEAWIKRSAAGAAADGVIFDADGRYSLTITAAGAILCKTSGGAASAGALLNDVWTHVACVVGGGAVRVYMNGVELTNAAGSITASPTSAEAIGGNSPSGEPFLGAIDSLRIFRVARSAADIALAATP